MASQIEGACIIRKDLEGSLIFKSAGQYRLKIKYAPIAPDLIITLGGKSFAFVFERCLRSIDASSLANRSVSV